MPVVHFSVLLSDALVPPCSDSCDIAHMRLADLAARHARDSYAAPPTCLGVLLATMSPDCMGAAIRLSLSLQDV
jgi:hypothetical protein